jgi:hypothetical protein
MRPEHDHWYIGRMETGEFVALPPIAVEALRLLGEELTADEVAARLHEAHRRDINVTGFVENLLDLGYVAAVDGQPVAGPQPIRPTWPWLLAHHARWTLSPVTTAVAVVVPLCAVVAAFLTPALVPSYHNLLWSTHTSLILVGNAAIAWTIIVLHELAHLCTARAAGVPGAALLVGLAVGPDSTGGRLLGATALLSLLFVPTQFLLFMRTDLYFVLQDRARCGKLYADGSAYLRYQGKRVWHAVTRRGVRPADPSVALPVSGTPRGPRLRAGPCRGYGVVPAVRRRRHGADRGDRVDAGAP